MVVQGKPAPGPDGEWMEETSVTRLPDAQIGTLQYPQIALFPQGPNRDQCPAGYTYGPIGEGSPMKSCIINGAIGKTKEVVVFGGPPPGRLPVGSGTPAGTRSGTPAGTRSGTGTGTRTGTGTGTGTRSGTPAMRTPTGAATRTGTGSSVPPPPPDMGRLKSMIMSKIDLAFEEFKSTSGGKRRRTHKRNSRSRR